MFKNDHKILSPSLPFIPFQNQVGGHVTFIRFTKNAVCKPLSSWENAFYDAIMDDKELSILKDYVPKFFGVVRVHPSLNADEISVQSIEQAQTGTELEDTVWQDFIKANYKKSDEEVEPPLFEMDDFKVGDLNEYLLKGHRKSESERYSSDLQERENTPYINPWSLKYYKTNQEELKSTYLPFETSYDKENGHDYLVLEDLTASLNCPCILDLKMVYKFVFDLKGTRQHGLGATEKKKLSQEKKVSSSTSGEYGVRLCGVQLHNPEDDCFYYQDKYDGRNINSLTYLKLILSPFFQHPSVTNQCLVLLKAELENLKTCIISLENYRFFSSSLLMIFDGFREKTRISVKLVDFAHTLTRNRLVDIKKSVAKFLNCHDDDDTVLEYLKGIEGEIFDSYDSGYVLGLDSIIGLINEFILDETKSTETYSEVLKSLNYKMDHRSAALNKTGSFNFANAREKFEDKEMD